MIIKALSPLLGTFLGRGELADGTEMAAQFVADELIPNLCYGMRFDVRNAETGDFVINAYIVATGTKGGNDISLHLIDAKESFSDLRRVEGMSADHTYTFQAVRNSGGLYRIEFGVESAERFSLSVSVASQSDARAKELWAVRFERVHRHLGLRSDTADESPQGKVPNAA
jgi:hypothetical protein